MRIKKFAFFIQIIVWITLKTKRILTAIKIYFQFLFYSFKVCAILVTDIQTSELYFTPCNIENLPDYPHQVATSSFRSSHCYITFHAYSVVICIEIKP